MNNNDLIELILEHAIQQGRYNRIYFENLQKMTKEELESELDFLEEVAYYG